MNFRFESPSLQDLPVVDLHPNNRKQKILKGEPHTPEKRTSKYHTYSTSHPILCFQYLYYVTTNWNYPARYFNRPPSKPAACCYCAIVTVSVTRLYQLFHLAVVSFHVAIFQEILQI